MKCTWNESDIDVGLVVLDKYYFKRHKIIYENDTDEYLLINESNSTLIIARQSQKSMAVFLTKGGFLPLLQPK